VAEIFISDAHGMKNRKMESINSAVACVTGRVVLRGGTGRHVPLTRLRRPPYWNWFSDPWVGCL